MDAVQAFVSKSNELTGRQAKEELNVDTAVQEYDNAIQAATTGGITQDQAEQLDALNNAVESALKSIPSSGGSRRAT